MTNFSSVWSLKTTVFLAYCLAGCGSPTSLCGENEVMQNGVCVPLGDSSDSSDASDASDSSDASDPSDSSDSSDSTDASDTSDSSDPSDASDASDSSDPADASDASDTSDASDAADSSDVSDASDPGPSECGDPAAANFDETAPAGSSSGCLYNVTFQVNMNTTALNADDVVYVNGTFNDWCGECAPMTDTDGDGIWTFTYAYAPGTYEFLYTINGWTASESLEVGGTCDYLPNDTFANRGFLLGAQALDLEPLCYGSCDACPQTSEINGCMDADAANYSASATVDDGSCTYWVDFAVDMSTTALDPGQTVYLNGTFNGWCGACSPLADDDGDGEWTLRLAILAGSYEYKFTIDGWDAQESIEVGGSCDYLPTDTAANRGFEVTDAPLDLGSTCYSSCESCPQGADVFGCMDLNASNYSAAATSDNGSCTYAVTFSVDMSTQSLASNDVVYANGEFNDWCGTCNPMAKNAGTDVWELTLFLSPGEYQYKFTVNGWDAEESIALGSSCDYLLGDESANRGFLLETAALSLNTPCYSSCDACGN